MKGPMAKIRNYRETDLDALYRICLETGASGKDATPLYRDHKIVGHVYAAPYAKFSPETAFVLEDDEGVGGYIIGPADTHAFELRLEREWWPKFRKTYPDPDPAGHEKWGLDERMMYLIHHPQRTPRRLSEPYPAHLHIDLLPRLQGRGFGRTLIESWSECVRGLGACGFHLGVGAANERAIGFYRTIGLGELEHFGPPREGYVFGRRF